MAISPFVAGDSGDPTAGLPDASMFSKLQDQWNTFLGKPEGQAALLSFGINMLQPPSFGDNPLAQAGRAVGAAGETVGNIEAMNIKKEEAASKQELRASQAETAAAKASAAGQGVNVALGRLENAQTLTKLKAAADLHSFYNAYRTDITRNNSANAILNPEKVRPVDDMQTWLAKNPSMQALARQSGLFGDAGAGSGGGSTLSGEDQQALDWANANPSDPRAAAIRSRLRA